MSVTWCAPAAGLEAAIALCAAINLAYFLHRAAQYWLSPRASKDLADRFAAVLNSVGDQLFPPDR